MLVKCRFNLKIDINGLEEKKYRFIDFGGRFAKIKKIYRDGEYTFFILESKHVRKDFKMEIETIWKLKDGLKTFEIVSSIVSINIFGIDNEIFVIPKSHKNTLQKWFMSR